RSPAYLPEESPAVPVTTADPSPPAGASENDELRQENRRLCAKVEQLESRVNELLSSRQPAAAATAVAPTAGKSDAPPRIVRTRRVDQGSNHRDSSAAEIRRIRQEANEAVESLERELTEVHQQLDQSQRECKTAADEARKAAD